MMEESGSNLFDHFSLSDVKSDISVKSESDVADIVVECEDRSEAVDGEPIEDEDAYGLVSLCNDFASDNGPLQALIPASYERMMGEALSLVDDESSVLPTISGIKVPATRRSSSENDGRFQPLHAGQAVFEVQPPLPKSIFTAGIRDGGNGSVMVIPEETSLEPAPDIPTLQKNVRNLWALKVHLQVACGIEPYENLRVDEVVEKAIDTIQKLEAEELECRSEMSNLVKQQAHLFDRVAYYKKLYS